MQYQQCVPAHATFAVRRAGMTWFLSFLIVFFSFFSFTRTTIAQAVYGSVVGTVTDATGAVIPGAKVTVTDVSKGITQQVKSNATGGYEVTVVA